MKKPLYTGDPNATMTMCPKKLRRHLGRDVLYIPIAYDKDGTPTDTRPKVALLLRCKHCHQDPFIATAE